MRSATPLVLLWRRMALPKTETVGQLSPAAWRAASAAILIGAALLRFHDLELTPLHHDEGVNSWFITRLFREGVYVYDPRNYHGPTLYYAALLSTCVLGLGTTALRVAPA